MPKHTDRQLEMFRAAVAERVIQMNVAWIQVEQGINDREVVDELRRELHTLKGEAALLGYKAISKIAHALEDLLSEALEPEATPPPEIGDQLLSAFDLISTLSEQAPSEDKVDPEVEAFIASLAVVTTKSGQAEAPSTFTRHDPEVAPEPMRSVLDQLTPDAEYMAPVSADRPRKAQSYAVRVNPRQLDRIRDIIGELLLTRSRLATSAAALHRERHGGTYGDESRQTLGELGRDELLRSVESQLRDDVLRMSNLVSALDEVTRELRMVSIGVLFERYPVAVRAMSRDLGKQVQLVCRGEAVEADRDVLEALDDPLLHLVRNALDHGIESPEIRQAAGKPSTGTLSLTATVTGDTLFVDVSDDGGGIDPAQVKELAIKRGMLDAGTARTMTQQQILRCLFAPGMSTRTQVTSMSGRGIGLDIVHKTIRNLGGTIDITTEIGAGTTFHISVPIRTSITSVLLFRIGHGWYGVPNSALVAIVELDEYPLAASISGPALHYKDSLVPLIPLDRLLDEPKFTTKGGRRTARVVIVRSGSVVVGLTGSYNHIQREAVLKPVGSILHNSQLINAALALEDGSVALVLSLPHIVRAHQGSAVNPLEAIPSVRMGVEDSRSSARVQAANKQEAKTVLVAEDSPIVRDLVAEALRLHGLRVIEAVDGQDALDKLREHPEVVLLITDVEMPRLDGLNLIRRMRDQQGRRIPAVVVSTKGSEADKLAAVEVGADAYLVKSDFSQEGLWALVSRFLG